MASTKRHHKEKMICQKEDEQEEPEVPKYRDRAKEHREDQNPDYEPTELGSFHAVAPPGTVDLRQLIHIRSPLRTENISEVVYQWIVKPHSVIKPNEMFLPGRMAYL